MKRLFLKMKRSKSFVSE